MRLHSAIYVGHVRHRRRDPAHAFTFPLHMAYLDLAEIDRVLSMSRLWGRSPLSVVRFRREDYLTRDGLDLDGSVRRCVEEALGRRPTGPIRMLTHLRHFGYVFNPVSFYYSFDESERLSAIVAEVTNTPWQERHAYVLDAEGAGMRSGRCAVRRRFGKAFHVSPFLPMDLDYDWTFSLPSESLVVQMNLHRREGNRERVIDATLRLERRELSAARMRGAVVRYPLMTAQVIAMIHAQALRLWLKGARVHTHPRGARGHAASPQRKPT